MNVAAEKERRRDGSEREKEGEVVCVGDGRAR